MRAWSWKPFVCCQTVGFRQAEQTATPLHGSRTVSPPCNQLIASLPARAQHRLLALCEHVSLSAREVLCETGQTLRHAYFPESGFICLLTQVAGHPNLEVAMLGREGMLGLQLALGLPCEPWQAEVQVPGMAWRISARALRTEIGSSAALRRCLDHYQGVILAQMVTAAGCLHFHLIAARLACWLLSGHDRVDADAFYVTHETLASHLGVRRVSVTVAAGAMQANGLISYHRGELAVLDRPGLEAMACACYEQERAIYQRLLKPH